MLLAQSLVILCHEGLTENQTNERVYSNLRQLKSNGEAI